MKRIPTIREIAAHCGCNNSTVSRALNNHPGIPAQTRERILDQAKKLGWKRNPLAAAYMSHLASTRPSQYRATLAWVISHAPGNLKSLNPMHRDTFEGARERANARGYKLELISLQNLEYNIKRFERMLKSRGIPGFVIHGIESLGKDVAKLHWDSFAVATWGYTIPSPPIHRAAFNMTHGIRMALARLRQYGYRRIGMVLSDEYDQIVNQGFFYPFYYIEQRKAKGEWFGHCTYSEKEKNLKTKICGWLEKHRPQVIFGQKLVWEIISEMHWDVPGDIAFVSVSWYPEWPHIGGIDQRLDVAAANAIDLVSEQLTHNEFGIPEMPKLILHEGNWIDGSSVPDLTKA